MPHSVLRRYTPPTCTLEIIGNHSPLSRWMAQPVVKNLRFQLSLDDPKLLKDEWVTVRGDRVQLEALCEAVSSYVQHFLEQSPNRIGELVSVSSKAEIAPLAETAIHDAVGRSPQPNGAEISLQPQGLLSHNLRLGSLATEETGSMTPLSTLQLFDLANALDEYASEIVALPNLQPARTGWLKSSPAWAQVAAIGLVVVGLSTSVVKLFDESSRTPEPPIMSQGATSRDQTIANQLPPTVTENATPPVASKQPLPPPPTPGATVPATPSLPTVTVSPVIPPSPNVNLGESQPIAPGSALERRDRSEATAQNSITLDETGEGIALAPAPALKPELGDNPVARRSASSESPGVASSQAPRALSAPAQTSTAFDTIPQVAEVRQYFQQRWTPPEGLTQTIEYTLVINQNGSVQQILPLGQTAGDYVDRSGIPLVGEPFVSPLKTKPNAKIRLVLSPDGKVQTFLE